MHWLFGDRIPAINYWEFKTKDAAGANNCMAWNQSIVGTVVLVNEIWHCFSLPCYTANSSVVYWRLGFLEPMAFEEGILERYPVLLSIVLNHISDDSLEFSYAVNCLRLLFEMLGMFSQCSPLQTRFSFPWLIICLTTSWHFLFLSTRERM